MVSQAQETTPGDIDRSEFSKKLSLTRHLHNLVSEHPDFEVFHEPTADLYCFRYMPNAMAERQEEWEVQSQLDRLNQEIVDTVQRSGIALVTTTRIGNCVAIGMSTCSHRISAADVDVTFESIARWGHLLSRTSYGNEESAQVEEESC